jgi:non-lysosomal glucosylceramidase
LRDWEIMNRPAKGFTPQAPNGYGLSSFGPFFAIYVKDSNGKTHVRGLEGPIDPSLYEGAFGSAAINHGLPRFRKCEFAAAYPLGQVFLSDRDMPVDVKLQAFNPLVPGDAEASGMPVAALRYVLKNKTDQPLKVSVCGTVPNFIGDDGSGQTKDYKGDLIAAGGKVNHNQYRQGKSISGIFMSSDGIAPRAPQWGTIALATTAKTGISHRVAWLPSGTWGLPALDFWDDFAADGKLDERESDKNDKMPMASLAVACDLPPKSEVPVTFLITWHFPNRMTWSPKENDTDRIGNYYTTTYKDAWDVAERAAPQLGDLEKQTIDFVSAFSDSSLPNEVKEAALFNLSTLRTQTCFRTEDGRFYGWEGSGNHDGSCHGSCTHVWNYEQATPFLFGSLSKMMREIEFAHATDDQGLMSFRVDLPLDRAQEWNKAAADGQMGCIMKMYRDWQLSGDDQLLKALWPKVKKAVEFCWIPGGWDANKDGVMEGCQHNTMDVEYYGPNPQMTIWYLGALRAAGKMARRVGDDEFAATSERLSDQGSKWVDANLFNGEFYEQHIQPPKDASQIAPCLRVGMGAKDPTHPDYQIGSGCLVDQLVGQYMAHVCGLGYLVNPSNVRTTLDGIMKYNYRDNLYEHFNCLRSFGLGDESVLLMADYPKDRPKNPFPYFSEEMTGFEYTASVGMLYEGKTEQGLRCIKNIRDRYDGQKRSPFDEAECGHHYARAMASWAATLALTEFRYSGVDKTMTFTCKDGKYFWSNGYAWGNCSINKNSRGTTVLLSVLHGELNLSKFSLGNGDSAAFKERLSIPAGSFARFEVVHY